LHEDILQEILGDGKRDTCEKNAMDHASITVIKKTEGMAVTALGRADQVVVRVAGLHARVHDCQTWEDRAKFGECSHDGSIETRLCLRS
jgi:hypothetical protein